MLFLFKWLLLFIVPTLAFPLQPEPLPPISFPTDVPLQTQADQLLLNYDELLDWIENIEDDERYTPDQIERIAYFLTFLARNGATPSNPISSQALEQDIQSFLCDSHSFRSLPHGCNDSYSMQSPLYYSAAKTTLYKGWVKKQRNSLKKFVKKHKTAIIIGVAIVVVTVAVIAVIAVTGATAATSAVAAAAAATGAAHDESEKSPPSLIPQECVVQAQPTDPIQTIEQVLPNVTSSFLANVIEENVAPVRETLIQEAALEAISSSDPSSWALIEKARELGACAAHEILDGIAMLGEAGPQLMSEIGEVGSRLFPEMPSLPSFGDTPVDPIGRYNGLVQTLHEKIDDVFDTDQAQIYAADANKNDSFSNFTVGMLPPPSIVGAFTGDLKQFAEVGKAFDRERLTRAGRALAKHGGREKNLYFLSQKGLQKR